MAHITTTCTITGQSFVVTEMEQKYYELQGFPLPTFCPAERARKRLVFRNDQHLYSRKCDLTGKQIISVFSPDKPFPVYDQTAWWGDDWDASKFGRDFDFSRPFFDQFQELLFSSPDGGVFCIQFSEL